MATAPFRIGTTGEEKLGTQLAKLTVLDLFSVVLPGVLQRSCHQP